MMPISVGERLTVDAALTVRYPVLEVTAMVEPFENGRGFSLRVRRASKPRVVGGHKAGQRMAGLFP